MVNDNVAALTMNQVISKATKDYLAGNPIYSVEDILKIENGVLEKVHEMFDEHNVICDKDKKWTIPRELSFAQIAVIMSTVFTIRNIRCCPQNNDPEYDFLGIYIDETVVELLGKYKEKLGTYVISEEIFVKIATVFKFSITEKECKEIISRLKSDSPVVLRCAERDLVAVANGIFNYASKELLPFSKEHVFLAKSQVAYNPNATLPVITMPDGIPWNPESWMSSLSDDPEVVNLLWEITGAIIRPNVRWNKSAWMVSDTGNNGKGTLCEMMRQLCGDGVCVSIPLSDFSKDFALEPLIYAQAIIVDENDVGVFIDKVGNLKSIITNDVISMNRKFKTPIAFQFKGFMVQCLNEKPRFKDKSESFYRRQLFIPMTKCFTGAERKYIKNEYLHRQDVLEYIMKRVLEMNYYTLSEPACCREALNEYKEYNDPVRQFWSEVREEFVWNILPRKFLIALYHGWYKENCPSGHELNTSTFMEELKKIVQNDDMWRFTGEARVKKDDIGKPELLIYTYGLQAPWRSEYYKGNDEAKISTPDKLKEKYTNCLVRR